MKANWSHWFGDEISLNERTVDDVLLKLSTSVTRWWKKKLPKGFHKLAKKQQE